MKLVIAEKPSFGHAVAKVLGANNKNKGYIEGSDVIVTWCVGHLVGLAMPERYGEQYKTWSFDTLPIIPKQWYMNILKDTYSQYMLIKKLLNDSRVDEVVCATDAGREGECIFRYVYRLSGCHKPVLRLWVSSNEEKAISKGFSELRPDSDFDDLYKAGLCRSKADWLIGLNLSRLFTLRYNSLLTIGRVQTPTLGLIVQRDSDIESFVRKKYFDVEINCGTFKAVSEHFDDEAQADTVAESCNGKTAVVSNVEKNDKTSQPPKLFSLSALQTAASKRFGYTAMQVLNIAQSLYDSDKKLTTYPRTNSQYLTDEMEDSTLDVISKILTAIPELDSGISYTPNIKRCINSKKVEDHHAIIPTAEIISYDLSSLKEEEKNILYLICERLLLAAAPVHKYEETKVTLSCEGNEFKCSEKVVTEEGYKALERFFKQRSSKGKIDKKENEQPTSLPIRVNESFKNVTAAKCEHFTTPPKPYTDGTLISEMMSVGKTGIIDKEKREEIRGIGTESTRAATIEELVKRGYVERKKSALISTKKGRQLISVVPDEVKSPQMTADWESRFYDIERGKASDKDFLSEIEMYVCDMVKRYNSADSSLSFNEVVGKCPRCGKNVIEQKLSFSCESGRDGCGFTLWKNDKVRKITLKTSDAKKLLSEGKAKLNAVNKSGEKYHAEFRLEDTGEYVNLVYVPIENDDSQKQSVGICPKCGKKVIVREKGYFCEGGKSCGFVIWKNICGKNITESAAKDLLEHRETGSMKGFKSKKGKSFTARLILEQDDSVSLKFD